MFNEDIVRSESKFINKTLMYMALGLIISFGVSYMVATSESAIMFLYSNSKVPMVLFILELIMVFSLSRFLNKMSVGTAMLMFVLYSVVNGLTLSCIFLIYQLSSVISVFLVAAAMYFCCSMIGITTGKDLSTLGRIAIMALFGVIVVSLLNYFFPFGQTAIILDYISVVIFCALTAYDMQKVKNFHKEAYRFDGDTVNKFAIVSALSLYLDFINLFISLLSIFGKER